jgi:hypothetical protein
LVIVVEVAIRYLEELADGGVDAAGIHGPHTEALSAQANRLTSFEDVSVSGIGFGGHGRFFVVGLT